MKRAAHVLFVWVLSLALTGLLLYNFMAQMPSVERMARDVACAGMASECAPAPRRYERTPWRRTWVFDVGEGQVTVVCQRAYVLLGGFTCTRRVL